MSETIKEILARLDHAAHRGGAFGSDVLLAIAGVLPAGDITSLETGCGKSTIMFSNLSRRHYVFAYDDRDLPDSSVTMVQSDPEVKGDRIEWVYGPTQRTIPFYKFPDGLLFDVMLIDGPHGYPFPDLEYAFLYEKLKTGGILIIDDVHIPSIGHMFDVLRADRMYDEVGVFATTGVLRRTGVAGVPSDGDHWYEQQYNYSQFPRSMDKYHLNRSAQFGEVIALSDPAMVLKHGRRAIEISPDGAGAQTLDIGATLEFDLPQSDKPVVDVAIKYKTIHDDVAKDAVIVAGGQSFPLPLHKTPETKTFSFQRPADSKLIITLLHPRAIPEDHRKTKRYEFRRLGALIASITLSENEAQTIRPESAAVEAPRKGVLHRLRDAFRT